MQQQRAAKGGILMKLQREPLRITRARAKCSQSRLAKLSGVGRFKISQHEMGYESLTEAELNHIISILKKKTKQEARK